MAESDSSSAPPAEREGSPDTATTTWSVIKPYDGNLKYVQALQMMGLFLARKVPQKVADAAITPLGTPPTGSLLVGNFESQTKERLLNHSCIYVLCLLCEN